MMTDRSLNLVIWRVRVASDYWLILTKLSILDALCGAELRMSADDQGTTASRAARNILRCGFIRGLLRHGYSAENSQAVFWLSPYLCTHSDPLAYDLKRRLMFRLCGLPLVRQAGGSCFRDLSLPVVRKANPTPIAPAAAGYRLAATLLNVRLRLVPTVPITTTAATAINAAIKPYSIAVTPSSFSIKRRKHSRLRIISSPFQGLDDRKWTADLAKSLRLALKRCDSRTHPKWAEVTAPKSGRPASPRPQTICVYSHNRA